MIGGTPDELRVVDVALRHLIQRFEDRGRGVPGEFVRLHRQVSAVLNLQEPSISASGCDPGDGAEVQLPPALLTYRQVADALQVSESSIERAVRSGELGVFQLGRSRRIAPAELSRFIERRTNKP